MTVQIAHLYATVCVAIIFFQIALIAGAPWGAATQGGFHPGKLPLKNRVLAALSIPVLLFMAAAILSAGGFAGGFWPKWTGWAAVAVSGMSALANIATKSKIERQIWAPITVINLAMALYVVVVGP